MLRLTTFLLLFLWASNQVLAAETFDFRKKSQAKEQSRWTLQEWLEQKERNQLMDLWLAMNAPSPYEFYLSLQHSSFESDVASSGSSRSGQAARLSLGAYASILGLDLQHQKNWIENFQSTGASLNLRLLGRAVQGTHLILSYGAKSTLDTSNSNAGNLYQHFWGADLSLHLNRHFGLFGRTESYFPISTNTGEELTETSLEYGLFVDFDFVRLSGGNFSDQRKLTSSGTTSSEKREGFRTALTFFF